MADGRYRLRRPRPDAAHLRRDLVGSLAVCAASVSTLEARTVKPLQAVPVGPASMAAGTLFSVTLAELATCRVVLAREG